MFKSYDSKYSLSNNYSFKSYNDDYVIKYDTGKLNKRTCCLTPDVSCNNSTGNCCYENKYCYNSRNGFKSYKCLSKKYCS